VLGKTFKKGATPETYPGQNRKVEEDPMRLQGEESYRKKESRNA